MGNHQLIIFTQLLQAIAGMQRIDELLQWTANVLVQRLELEAVQIWSLQDDCFRQISIKQCITACRQVNIPKQILINSHVAEAAKRLCNEHYTVTIPQVTEAIFSSQAAHHLTRYNLNYWACYQLTNSLPIQSAGYQYPLNRFNLSTYTLISFFTRQPPNPRLIPTIGYIMEQVINLAYNRGLLLPEKQLLLQAPAQAAKADALLMKLIPQRNFDNEANQGKHVQVITSRQVRRLYLSIDGRRNLANLAVLTQLHQQAFMQALRSLLTQERIQLYEPDGHFVDGVTVLSAL
ncbi:hypothetical protein [Dictyobacter formicarum]|uniref:Uncharacterized protein n=1 Tax=Dictyobacter formicarum TaxID=2778368 RepID=A0ABQ3VTP9_9CHLR|nr:hypothetical protein [Dictyobacter formicarum]GHO89004.1 hypothetical protein KSZ_70100 [Dictyobacter formicarum]